MEQVIEMLLQCSVFLRIFTSQQISLFQKVTHMRSLFIDVVLVPSLLQIVSTVGHTIRVSESDVFDIVAGTFACTGREVILYILHQQGMAADEDIHQHGFTSAVRSYDSDMLVIEKFKTHWLLHAPFRHTGHSVVYFYYFLHSLYVVFAVVLLILPLYFDLGSVDFVLDTLS